MRCQKKKQEKKCTKIQGKELDKLVIINGWQKQTVRSYILPVA